MAKILKPDSKGTPPRFEERNSKGTPPALEERSHNLSKRDVNRKIIINFNATEEFRRELKIYATELGLTVTDVIMEAIEMHKRMRR